MKADRNYYLFLFGVLFLAAIFYNLVVNIVFPNNPPSSLLLLLYLALVYWFIRSKKISKEKLSKVFIFITGWAISYILVSTILTLSGIPFAFKLIISILTYPLIIYIRRYRAISAIWHSPTNIHKEEDND
tara:strand:+ start:931 stop:1320 length:390 start_codon:yes stop_codon:yes gene_type:complete